MENANNSQPATLPKKKCRPGPAQRAKLKGKVKKENPHHENQTKKLVFVQQPKQNKHYNFITSAHKMLVETVFKDDKLYLSANEPTRTAMVKAKFDSLKESNPALHTFYKSMLGQMLKTYYGLKMPKVWLYGYGGAAYGGVTPGKEISSAAPLGAISFVYALNGGVIAGFGLWAALFDEYRPAGPFVYKYRPRVVPATGYASSSTPVANGYAYALGVLDYIDTSTAITSLPLTVLADTHKIFPLNGYTEHVTEFHGHIIGIPDETWLNVTSLGVNWVALKVMEAYNVYQASDVYWGVVSFAIEMEFRGMTGV